jgi:hypothetical protein
MIRRDAPDMKVRLSADLRGKIETAARSSNRTMNAEIAARLEQSFAPSSGLEKRLSDLESAVIAMMFDQRFEVIEKRLATVEGSLNKTDRRDFS